MKYSEAKQYLKEGMKVKILTVINRHHEGCLTSEIQTLDSVLSARPINHCFSDGEELDIITNPDEKVETRTPKVGDLVRITNPDSLSINRGAKIGDIYPIFLIDETAVVVGLPGAKFSLLNQEEFELVDATPPTIPEQPPFKVGDTVKLNIKEGYEPRWGFGKVKNGEIGKIRKIEGSRLVIDFPSQSHWTGFPEELEKIEEFKLNINQPMLVFTMSTVI